ncbi:MAG TPA: sialidase family protein [Myxococcales bacterium]
MRIYVGTRKGLFTIQGGEVAAASFLGTPVTAVLPRDGTVYAAVGHGHFGAKLHRSGNGGETWEEIAAPKYPEKPADAVDKDPVRNKLVPWSTELIWTLEASGKTIWCGTIPGGLFRSDDSGASWSLVRPLWDRPERKQWFGG